MKTKTGPISVVTPKIIAADDNREYLTLIKALLEMEGYRLFVSVNAENLIGMICTEKPDVILLDVQMKGINGFEICKELKESNLSKSIPVIIISAEDDLEKSARLCGADGYLSKPFSISELLIIIDNILKGEPFNSH